MFIFLFEVIVAAGENVELFEAVDDFCSTFDETSKSTMFFFKINGNY